MEASTVNGATTNGNTTKLPLRSEPKGLQNGNSSTNGTDLQNGKAPESNDAQGKPTTQNGSSPNHDQKKDDQHGILSSFDPSELAKFAKSKKGPPGGIDATPLPSVPQGYTIRFTFRSAANLPPSDLNTASSDPFLTATLTAAGVKRHKDDPDLLHRTPTIQRTTEPEWHDEWVVANVPASGFTLKCRLYDEDAADADDRLGNVTIKVPTVFDQWDGFPPPGREFKAKKRPISKRAFIIKAISSMIKHDVHMTPRLTVSIEVLGKSDPPYGQMCTIGPACWTKHYSPLIGRLAGTKVDADEDTPTNKHEKEKTQKYDFQANQMQLRGPVPSDLYHRFVEFKPIMGSLFASTGLRGKILNKALHKQHNRIYNYDRTTEHGFFEPCTEEASLQFLKMAHFDEGGRMFTYVLTLDACFRFTETGKEFGIDMLSKHNMHSNVQHYIACSGEFMIRRLQKPDANDDPEPNEGTHPDDDLAGGPPHSAPPQNPSYYQLIIDNDSGTYRPDKHVLPDLKAFLERQFPGLAIVVMHWEDEELQKLKENQRNTKKKEGRMVNVVLNRSQSSISSAESELDDRHEGGQKSKREAALEAVAEPKKAKDVIGRAMPGGSSSGVKA
ncbi:hypothetical protein CC79DRAFT_574268 [Sarocladium strictum]